MKEMAAANGYISNFYDICHIVPLAFIKQIMQGTPDKVNAFIEDLAEIHKDATFYNKLDVTWKEYTQTNTTKFKNAAKQALAEENMEDLEEMLNTIPSNLYPGKDEINKEIAENLDPPKKDNGSKERSNEATQHAKELYAKYKDSGLNIKEDSGKALSSDYPPGDSSAKYITIS